eukprot:SAG31_NODE_325_length_17671_cov_9.902743_13_plen_294_part_00
MGYVVQAITAQRAQRATAEQASEQHVAEQNRQRSHEQMQAQIRRTDRWCVRAQGHNEWHCFAAAKYSTMCCSSVTSSVVKLRLWKTRCTIRLDDCCRPVAVDMEQLLTGRLQATSRMIASLETTHPELVSQMVSLAASSYPIREDGRVVSTRTGQVVWEPHAAGVLTQTFKHNNLSLPTAAAMSIANRDAISQYAEAFCRELPMAILEVVAAEPTSAVAVAYRRYCSAVMLPVCQRVMETLLAHQAAIQWPMKDFLASRFPAVSWRSTSGSFFSFFWAVCEECMLQHFGDSMQ